MRYTSSLVLSFGILTAFSLSCSCKSESKFRGDKAKGAKVESTADVVPDESPDVEPEVEEPTKTPPREKKIPPVRVPEVVDTKEKPIPPVEKKPIDTGDKRIDRCLTSFGGESFKIIEAIAGVDKADKNSVLVYKLDATDQTATAVIPNEIAGVCVVSKNSNSKFNLEFKGPVGFLYVDFDAADGEARLKFNAGLQKQLLRVDSGDPKFFLEGLGAMCSGIKVEAEASDYKFSCK